ncbi:hypothetical protein JCM10908_006813 [Rhodotorula pacifica]|uniref:uncharacterized protein n=1 Tax=Rhodotorula pacifica TaxID=1495444 RepID=UPI0031721D71
MANATRAIVPIGLHELIEALPPLAAFRGRVVDIRPFSSHTQLAQLTLASVGTSEKLQARVHVELKGPWAENAAKRITKGDVLVLTTKGIALLGSKGRRHEKKDQKEVARVRFDDGMTGWIQRRDGSEDLIQYKPSTRKGKVSQQDPKRAEQKKSVAEQTPEATAQRAGQVATATTGSADVVNGSEKAAHIPAASSVPVRAGEPSINTVAPMSETSTAKAQVSAPVPTVGTPVKLLEAAAADKAAKVIVHSAPGEGTRSRKRQKREDALGWGLQTDACAYSSLAQVAEIVQAADASALQTKRASVIVLVTQVGEAYPPKPGARIANWYRQLRVVDPTHKDEPIELQWYAATQAGLPDVRLGQILLARNLLIRKLANAAPMLLCGSFSKLAHAVLDPDALRPRAKNGAEEQRPMEEDTHPDRLLVTPDVEELAYATQIAEWLRRTGMPLSEVGAVTGLARPAAASTNGEASAVSGANAPPAYVRPQRPLLRIGEIVEGQFCDLIGMVIKLHTPRPLGSLPSNVAASLYLTDYTSHPLLHDYPDPSPVTLPGRLTLQLSLFGSTAAPLAPLLDPRTGETKRGRLVWIRNVRIKLNPAGELEGTVVEDTNPRFRAKVSVEVVDMRRKDHQEKWGDRAKEFQKRHREYWSALSLAGKKMQP